MGTYVAILALAAAAAEHALHEPPADYAGVAVAAAVGWAGVPGPGEAVVIAAGIAASHGHLDITPVLAIAWAGATAGGIVGWLVGRHGGRRVVLAGRRLRARRERVLHHGHRLFDRYGVLAVYVAPSWMAGLNSMSAARFLPANAISALVWALLVGLGAFVIGPSIEDVVADVGLGGAALLVAAAVGAAVVARRRLHRGAGG